MGTQSGGVIVIGYDLLLLYIKDPIVICIYSCAGAYIGNDRYMVSGVEIIGTPLS